jgi:hypothetical protein
LPEITHASARRAAECRTLERVATVASIEFGDAQESDAWIRSVRAARNYHGLRLNQCPGHAGERAEAV